MFRSVITLLPGSGYVIQDCGSGHPDPKVIFTDPGTLVPQAGADTGIYCI
jgi:hypothetical protein